VRPAAAAPQKEEPQPADWGSLARGQLRDRVPTSVPNRKLMHICKHPLNGTSAIRFLCDRAAERIVAIVAEAALGLAGMKSIALLSDA
jgi:hypothetical protein